MKEKLVALAAKMALPTLVKMVRDIINSTDLTGMRETMMVKMLALAKRTDNTFDDTIAEKVVAMMFLPETMVKATEALLPPIKAFVLRSETKWDDEIFIPMLDAIEELVNRQEEK